MHSPGGCPGPRFGEAGQLRGSPFVGADPQTQLAQLLGAAAAGGLGGGRSQSLGMAYSPDGSLTYGLGGSGPASLEPQPGAAQLAGGGGLGPPQQASLLAQLQQIWGEGSGGGAELGAGGLPGFGAGLGASPAAALLASSAAAQQAAQAQQVAQQQQQLAALLFMQQLELQQAALAGQGAALTPGRRGGAALESPPVSPQQLPPASADMLREVLGSPLSPLRWPAEPAAPATGASGDLLAAPSLSLGAELAAAAATALRQMGEAPEEAGGTPGRQPQRRLLSPERPSFESVDLDALGFTESLD